MQLSYRNKGMIGLSSSLHSHITCSWHPFQRAYRNLTKRREKTYFLEKMTTKILISVLILLILVTACDKDKGRSMPASVELSPTLMAVPVITDQPLDEGYSVILETRLCETYNPSIGEKEGETYSCGIMIVPQDRERPGDEQIEIKYAILKSTSDSPRPDPIVLLSGGPGNSALYPDAFAEMAERFGLLRQERDIILFDQRGVGASSPQIDCSIVSPPEDPGRTELLTRYIDETGLEDLDEYSYQVGCVLGLWDQGVELSNFTSASSADDVVDLLKALQDEYGYSDFNLYAISYGTWLAETLARDFPEEPLIRSFVLDSVLPRPKSEYIADFYISKHGMLEHLFEACAADSSCDEDYPDLQRRFLSLVESLNESPLMLPNEMTLDGDQLYRSMYPFVDRGSNWVSVIPYLPRMIVELEEGLTDTYLGVQNGTLPPPTEEEYSPPDAVYDMLEIASCTAISDQMLRNDLYRQMYNVTIEETRDIVGELCTPEEAAPFLELLETMTPRDVNELVKRIYLSSVRGTSPTMRTHFNCSETFPFGEDEATIGAYMRQAEMPDFLVNEATQRIPQAIENCGVWPVPAVPASENEPVASSYPALFISGEWDYVTFPRWAEEAHGLWPNSYYLYAPNGMHSVLGNFGDCPTDITLQFFESPGEEPEMDCTIEMGIEWVTSP